jgi:hypothetical protein
LSFKAQPFVLLGKFNSGSGFRFGLLPFALKATFFRPPLPAAVVCRRTRSVLCRALQRLFKWPGATVRALCMCRPFMWPGATDEAP